MKVFVLFTQMVFDCEYSNSIEVFSTKEKGPRYLEMAEGYVLAQGLDENNEVIGYKTLHLGKMLEAIRNGKDPKEAFEKNVSTKGRFEDAVKVIDPRKE